MPRINYLMPPLFVWGPWVQLPGSAVASVGNQDYQYSIGTDLIGDAGIPQGEVQYVAPGHQTKVDSFFDSITITRDGGSFDEIKVRFKNAGGPTGCAIIVSY
ncbi:hypothetical protein M9Y10_035591 [Tritrichomonas musculus]|uniref:Uncharacterized protein n=1 Tax=Tritrichomonas musculus TaxID=1915356 RepID=A0ABR2GW73_9EUKA